MANPKNIIPDLTPTPAAVASATGLTVKITDKGGLSVYGLQRFPVTLYREQWEKLFAAAPKVKAFMDANADQLATKAAKSVADGRVAI